MIPLSPTDSPARLADTGRAAGRRLVRWVCEPSVRIRPAANNSTQPIWFPRAMAGPPDLDVAAIRAYCEQRVPPHTREDVRIEADLDSTA